MAQANLKIALIQFTVGRNKEENIERVIEQIRNVVRDNQPNLIVLPEYFNTPDFYNQPYEREYFKNYAETIPDGFTSQKLSSIAKELKIYIVGGSIPERNDDKLYNSCTVWSPSGELIAIHRKVHLFDVDIPSKIVFKETEVISPGNSFTVFEIENTKIGIGICHDIRFDEMARIYQKMGCKMIIYPAAFEMITGKLHWEIMLRGRAVDNQLYVLAVSPSHDPTTKYVTYGHSMVIDPWGKIIQSAQSGDEIILAEIDLNVVDEVRSQIPVTFQRRHDLYETIQK